jgi:hypothetical protein
MNANNPATIGPYYWAMPYSQYLADYFFTVFSTLVANFGVGASTIILLIGIGLIGYALIYVSAFAPKYPIAVLSLYLRSGFGGA